MLWPGAGDDVEVKLTCSLALGDSGATLKEAFGAADAVATITRDSVAISATSVGLAARVMGPCSGSMRNLPSIPLRPASPA
jgi:hypothetical protein